MDQHTFDKLEFDRIREDLAACCACTLGKTVARKIQPSIKPDVIRRWFSEVAEMEAARQTANLPPMGGVHDIHTHVHDAGTPAGLDAYEIGYVSEMLAATSNVAAWRRSLPLELARIGTIADRVGDYGAIAARIDRAVDGNGNVRDSASPRLAEIRRRIEASRAEVEQVFTRILRQPRVVRFLQYPKATFHDDRLVLPLKAEHQGHIRGIIHRSSDSGATLFVEPAEAVQLNNAIVALKEDDRKEVARILADLSLVVHKNAEGILHALDALSLLDLIAAKVRYMKKRDAVCPEVRDDRMLLLNQARHPVLLDLADESAGTGESAGRDGGKGRESVVPINVRLGDDFDLLVITGPNTGGKTVTLKTIGLLMLMAQCGVPIPCGPGSMVPVYRRMFIDVGDEQSIEQSLSTFSSHLSNTLHMLKHATDHSLVLLDELGSGTDPDEGAAIGRAIMEELLRIGCSAVVTTHLSALKAVAFTFDRVDNASVEFDIESLRPTFHLRIGEPGNSNAITIAHRLGMSKRMVQTARKYLTDKGQALNRAISGTLDSRRQAERARLEANQALLDAEQTRIHYETELKNVEREREAHHRWVQWINGLSAGDEVVVRKFNRRAKVVRLQLQKQTALVSAGALDMEVHLGELSKPS